MSQFDQNRTTYLACTNARQPYRTFGIRQADRLSHIYIIGKTGAGKSTLLETMVRQDLERGEGLTLLDPHGDLVERIAAAVPKHRAGDVVYFDVPDPAQPYGYNPLKHVAEERRALAASGLLDVFHKIWGERAWGQRMEHVLRCALLALLEQPDSILPDVLRLFRDDGFRKAVAGQISHKPVRDFWRYEYPKYPYRYRAEAVAPIVSKVSSFLADPRLHAILTEPRQPISLRRIMDGGKVLLLNLSLGRLGADSAGLLGGMLVTTMGLAGFSRADMPEARRRPHFLYLDEFQSFTTAALADMLPALRKYKVGMTVAHQYLHQLDEDVREAVLGNAGTLISFRLGARDATFIGKELAPEFNPLDLLRLPNYQICLKLMIEGTPSKPFSATTLGAA